jgi:hypothetical protein
MLKKTKFSKLAIVLFLTILIWVWADLALDESHTIFNAKIVIGRTRPELWISFSNGFSIDVNEIVLKGSVSTINNIDQIINNDPKKLEFPLVFDQFGIDKPGQYPVDVKDIIKESNWIKKEGLSVEKCDPCEVIVNAVALTQNNIDVQCFDEEGIPIDLETPQKVNMFVPSDWRTPARVDLSYEDIQKAVKQPIAKTPYIILPNEQSPNGQRKYADKTVEIKLSPQQNMLEQKKVKDVSLGFCLSQNLSKGQYQIDIDNLPDILSIEILTTQAAKDAYEEQRYQVMLEIVDDDINTTEKTGFVQREVYYLLPEEFVRQNQIKLAQPKMEAKFKVKPQSPPPAEVP